MEHEIAKEIMEHLRRTGETLNDVGHSIEKIHDLEEKRKFRKIFAEISLDVYEKIMAPIIRNHPTLDPDKEKL